MLFVDLVRVLVGFWCQTSLLTKRSKKSLVNYFQYFISSVLLPLNSINQPDLRLLSKYICILFYTILIFVAFHISFFLPQGVLYDLDKVGSLNTLMLRKGVI